MDTPKPVETIMKTAPTTIAPAISLAVYHGHALVVDQAWGWIDPDTQTIPASVDTLFDLASLTKLFTTTALLALVTAQQLSLDIPLVEIVPEFGHSGPRPIEGLRDPHTRVVGPIPSHLLGQTVDPHKVTLWHLLTHTSGLAPWRDLFMHQPLPADIPIQDDIAQRWANTLPLLYESPFVDHVGAVVRYSDLGLLLIGEVVARLQGDTLSNAIQHHVLSRFDSPPILFNPLASDEYTRSHIAPTEEDTTWRHQRVWGSVHDENAASMGGVAGHAGLFGTSKAVADFGRAWSQHAIFEIAPNLWEAATQEQAVTDQDRRGLGWMLRSAQNSSAGTAMSLDAFGHTGFTGTSLWIDPAHDIVVALMTNRVYFGRANAVGIHHLRRFVHDAIVEHWS